MLASQHIFLRKLQSGDSEDILRWENNPDNWEISGTKKPFTKIEIKSFINAEQDIITNEQMRYVICLNSTKQAIGTLDLFEYNVQDKKVGVGILIADIENRKNGYANEALNLTIDYCRNKLDLVTIFCNIIKNNTGSIRLFEKCGFKFIEKRILFENEVNYYELSL